jgi:hypothetical protein
MGKKHPLRLGRDGICDEIFGHSQPLRVVIFLTLPSRKNAVFSNTYHYNFHGFPKIHGFQINFYFQIIKIHFLLPIIVVVVVLCCLIMVVVRQ